MTALRSIRNSVLEQAITGQAVNREQDRRLVNATPEIDSLAEILAAIGTSTTGRTRALAAEGLRLVKTIRDLNDSEHACEHAIAGHAERLAQINARTPAWTIKRLAAELRPVLADLQNPMLGTARREQRFTRLAEIIGQAPAENLRSVWLRHELGVRKFSLLQEAVERVGARS